VIASYRASLGMVALVEHSKGFASLTRKADGKTQEYAVPGWAEFGPGGEALLNVKGADGRWKVTLQRFGERQPQFHSDGPWDLNPSLNPDGRTFLYTGDGAHVVYSCGMDAISTRDCRVLHTDPLSPMFPRLSPNGRLLAYTIFDAAGRRLRIVSLDGRPMRDLSVPGRGPVLWTSDTTLWHCEGGEARNVPIWTEVEATAGRPTGRTISGPQGPDQSTLCASPPSLVDQANFEVRRRLEVTEEVRLVRGM
jgi:hypothetical protein